MAPLLTSLTTIAPVPAKTREKVPSASEHSFFMARWSEQPEFVRRAATAQPSVWWGAVRRQILTGSSRRRHGAVTRATHIVPVKLATHLFIDACELAPGGEWPDRSPGWRIVLVSEGALYWMPSTGACEL